MEVPAAALNFWAAVEDCLVTFHHFPRNQAAESVAGLLQRLPTTIDDGKSGLENMIYHAEPWQIACNLANEDLLVAENQPEYQALLARNGLLASARPPRMPIKHYQVVSVLSAIKTRQESEFGRYRLIAIPVGAKIEVEGESETLSGMIEVRWNGQTYILFPADLQHKAQQLVA
jgi:hypothetical protein